MFLKNAAPRCPALSPYYEKPIEPPVTLYHGRQDIAVPPEPTCRIAERLFRNLESRLVDDDHNLHLVFPMLDWEMLLEMGERSPDGFR